MNQEERRNSVVVLPHWHVEGGAGFYIRDLLSTLDSNTVVKVAGRYAADYAHNPISSEFLDKLGALSVPAYEGVRPAATLFHLFVSLGCILQLWMVPKRKRFEDSPSAFIFTSSVQALSLPITRWFYPSSKIVIAVQEQVDLSRFFGKLISRLLRQSDVVLAITDDWAAHARKFGIDPLVIRNQYDPAYAAPENNQTPAIESDLLYVGGGGRIKGFDNFTAALPQLLERPNLRILCLGNYNYSARKTLDKIREGAKSGAQLNVIGSVPDIRPYLRGTKLLLLPIEGPHFCRPAIEAGLFSKTFIIPDYDGLDEFSVNNINCLKYNKGNVKKFVELTFNMLNSPENLSSLGKANMQVALNYHNSNEDAVRKLMKLLAIIHD